MGYLNEFPHAKTWDSDLRQILEMFNECKDLPRLFRELKEFVDKYFTDLDVQNEINSKLEDMYESGELSAMLQPFFNDIEGALEVTNARISTLVKLDDGEVEGYQEVVDARVDYTGKEWDSLGDHIRGLSGQLSSEIADLSSAEFSIQVTEEHRLNLGQRIDWDSGEKVGTSKKYAKSNKIANKGGTLLKVKDDEYRFRVAFYGEDNSYIGNNGSYADKEIIPTNVDYFSLTILRFDEADINETILNNLVDLYQKEDIGAIEKQINHDEILVTFELGSIGTTTGANTDSTSRIRTIGYIPLEDICYYADDGYLVGGRVYDKNCNYLYEEILPFSSKPRTLNKKDFPNAEYMRFIARKEDNSEIADVSEVANAIHLVRSNVDNTLTKKGYSADAYTVGKMINKSIKILGIGNSYTRDSFRWLCKILMDCGYDVVVGHGYWGGVTLAEQYASLNATNENHTVYQYWKYDNTKDAVLTSNVSLDSILSDETWDIVIFQQQSDHAGHYDSFVSETFDINDFVSYVKNAIGNDNLRIGITSTWSHAEGYTSSNFDEWYNGNPSTQYDAIQTVIPQVANHMTQCDFIINSGKAVDLGRNNTYLGALGDEMLRSDKNHLAYGIPSFMVGMVNAITLCGVKPSDVTWYPTITDDGNITSDTSAYLAYLAKQCALQASQSI